MATAIGALLGPLPAPPRLALALALGAALIPLAPLWVERRGGGVEFAALAALGVGLVVGVALALLSGLVALGAAPVAAALSERLWGPWVAGMAREPVLTSGRRSLGAGLSVAIGVVCVLLLARAAVFMSVPDTRWGSALPFYGLTHTCLPAYARAAELSADAPERVYVRAEYTREFAQASQPSTIARMADYAGDPYHYPPPLALAPGLLLHLTGDFMRLRGLWFGLSLLITLALIGGLASRLALPALWPLSGLVLVSAPSLYTLQYGQVHFIVVAAAVAAMVAFRARWSVLGGALLAAAIATKLFPGILVVVLLLRRQWRAVGWTALMGGLIVALSAAVYGLEPYWQFVGYQLPRLLDGRAFETFASASEFLVANYAFSSLVDKLAVLAGAADVDTVRRLVSLGSLLAVLAAAARVARRERAEAAELTQILALLCLGSLVGAYLPATYGAAPFLWLGALMVALRPPRRARGWLLVGGLAAGFAIAPYWARLPVLWKIEAIHVPGALAAQLSAIALAVVGLMGWAVPSAATTDLKE